MYLPLSLYIYIYIYTCIYVHHALGDKTVKLHTTNYHTANRFKYGNMYGMRDTNRQDKHVRPDTVRKPATPTYVICTCIQYAYMCIYLSIYRSLSLSLSIHVCIYIYIYIYIAGRRCGAARPGE